MRIGYLDCFSGVSGDMCLGACVDAGVPLDCIESALEGLPICGYALSAERTTRAGLTATKVAVELEEHHHHPHRGLGDVLEILGAGSLSERVLERSSRVFRRLAEAEARVHDTDPDSVHFHEVGAVDAICDIVGTVAALEELGLDALKFGTVMLGGGTVEAAHGTLPVPAPATAQLLKGFPTAGGPVDVELTTPTGAALITTLGEPAPFWPDMSAETVAYGAGGRDIPGLPNVLRLTVGEKPPGDLDSDVVWVLEANVDDMTGEEVGFCTEKLLSGGALDVWTCPIQMKKGRPGIRLTVLCAPERREALEGLIWRHTTTLGVRRCLWQRSKLQRESTSVDTPWGEVRVKVACLEGQMVRCEPEYEDCRALAEDRDLSLREVYRAAIAVFTQPRSSP